MSSTCTTARENPHWGESGVPFMKSTTGLAFTAESILERASSESHRTPRILELRKTEDDKAAGRRLNVVIVRIDERSAEVKAIVVQVSVASGPEICASGA